MSIAEIFLLVWAVGATVGCGILWGIIRKAVLYTKTLANLVCELATKDPEAKVTELGGKRFSVENEQVRLTFQRK
jgi:hypothetical protein